jgi:hypothetical protein
MDLENQKRVETFAEQYGPENWLSYWAGQMEKVQSCG